MFLSVKTVCITLQKISSQRNLFINLLTCNHMFSHPRPTIRLSLLSYTKGVISLGLMPLVPKVAAESEQNITKLDEIVNAKQEVKENPKGTEKTGWERVCAMYKFDEFGNASKELNATFQATGIACIVGLLYGGITRSRIALIDFMERNQASIFENPIDAKRRLQNHVSIHFGKGAIRWASKLSIFTGGFMLFLSSMTAYRGGYNVLDYGISGAVVGSVVRLRLGPPAIVVGGVLGGVLGLFCGLATNGLLSLTGSSFDEVISFQYEIEKKRQNLYKEAIAKSDEKRESSKGMLDLLKEREKYNKEKGF